MPVAPLTPSDIPTARRLCFFSHYDADGLIDGYVLHYLGALRDAGFTTLFVTSARLASGEQDKLAGLCADVIERENVGLDFGGWIDCLARYPHLEAELLLLCNDSVYGPFWPLADFIDTLTRVPADFYGALLSLDPRPHLQSWFLMLRPAAYDSPAFRTLMIGPMPSLTKIEIIERYELALTRRLTDAGLLHHAAFDPTRLGPILSNHPIDAAFAFWRELLNDRILPFVKISLLRDRPPVAGLRHWPRVLAALDPALTALATANLERRMRHAVLRRGRRIRELARLPALTSVHMPFVRPLLVRDMRVYSRNRAIAPGRDQLFETIDKLFRLVGVPYRVLYNGIGRIRRGRSS